MTETESVWVIDDDQSIRWVLQKALEKANMDVKSFAPEECPLCKQGIELVET